MSIKDYIAIYSLILLLKRLGLKADLKVESTIELIRFNQAVVLTQNKIFARGRFIKVEFEV